MKRSIRILAAGTALLVGLGMAPRTFAQGSERGQALFDLCASCHGADAGGNQTFLAPAIAGLPSWYIVSQLNKFRTGLRGMHFDDLAGMRMRPMALTLRSEADVEAVAAYASSLPPQQPAPVLTGGDPAKGQATFALCSACHGMNGEGSQPQQAPRLTYSSDWYLLEQLKKFKAGIRGADPRDPFSIMMRPMALTLADEQAMKDVVAYIMTLSE